MNFGLKRLILLPFSMLYKINPILEQKIIFRLKCGYKLKLDNPQTFNEKIVWLKLYDKNPLMPKLADKYLVREYITEMGYGDNLPKLYWNGFDAKDIPFDDLPEKFILKVTSGSGGNILVKNKDNLDKEQAIKQLNKWLHQKYLTAYGEWHYWVEKPRIIAEEYLDGGDAVVPPDYKMMYFNGFNGGDIAFTDVHTGRFVEHKRTLYDHNWKRMDENRISFDNDLSIMAEKPSCYEEMVQCAKKLAKPFAHARVDFYVIGDKFYVGEITFFNGAGYDMPSPPEFAKQMGDWIELKPPRNSKGDTL